MSVNPKPQIVLGIRSTACSCSLRLLDVGVEVVGLCACIRSFVLSVVGA